VERFGPTRRGGPVFRWLGEPLAIDFANTVMVVREGETVDLLGDDDELRRWLEHERDRLGDCRFAVESRAEILEVRDAVRALFLAAAAGEATPPAAVSTVNAASAAAPITPQLGSAYEPRAEDVTADSLAQLLGRLARSAIELLSSPGRDSLRVCQAPSCGMFYLGARRWCCAACGNRARAARHYARARRSRGHNSTSRGAGPIAG
jgi:predicted RNA-binding Zn ribbon-like protein